MPSLRYHIEPDICDQLDPELGWVRIWDEENQGYWLPRLFHVSQFGWAQDDSWRAYRFAYETGLEWASPLIQIWDPHRRGEFTLGRFATPDIDTDDGAFYQVEVTDPSMPAEAAESLTLMPSHWRYLPLTQSPHADLSDTDGGQD